MNLCAIHNGRSVRAECPVCIEKSMQINYNGKVKTMLTQNSFNKKQKAYDPFASNVKLVGDDITEKDYDDFFEGFNDPYGEKREQERQQKEQERKGKFSNIRANADNRTWSSQNDSFLEGFNSAGISKRSRNSTPDCIAKSIKQLNSIQLKELCICVAELLLRQKKHLHWQVLFY